MVNQKGLHIQSLMQKCMPARSTELLMAEHFCVTVYEKAICISIPFGFQLTSPRPGCWYREIKQALIQTLAGRNVTNAEVLHAPECECIKNKNKARKSRLIPLLDEKSLTFFWSLITLEVLCEYIISKAPDSMNSMETVILSFAYQNILFLTCSFDLVFLSKFFQL